MQARPMRSLLVCVAVLASACDLDLDFDLTGETVGKNGRAEFYYGGIDCFFGCSLDRPMVVGLEEVVHVQSTGGSGVPNGTVDLIPGGIAQLVSTDDGVNQGLTIRVRGESAGTTELQVRIQDGQLFDRVDLEVSTIDSIEIEVTVDEGAELVPGATGLVRSELFDSADRQLVGTGAVSWSVIEGEEHISVSNPFGSEILSGNWLSFEALSAGTVRLRADAIGGVTEDVTMVIE